MAELKHVGRIAATKKKCVVAYRTLPGDSSSCLIVTTENLPDSYHDSIINLVESPAGQSSHEFAEALARSTFSDGSTMLAALHTQGRLFKAPTSSIEMTPTTSTSIILSELNQIIAEQRGVAVDDLAIRGAPDKAPDLKTETKASNPEDQIKTTSTSVNMGEENVQEVAPAIGDTPEDQAKYYRSQADKLAKEAAKMRRLAEELVPTKKAK
jgi:hypothetical protein